MDQFVIDSWDKKEVSTILSALAAVDPRDLDYLESVLSDGGRGRFWKKVISDIRHVFEDNK